MTLRRSVSYAESKLLVILTEGHGLDVSSEWHLDRIGVLLLNLLDIGERHLILAVSSSSSSDGVVSLSFELLLLDLIEVNIQMLFIILVKFPNTSCDSNQSLGVIQTD